MNRRPEVDLFLASALVLLLELAAIRWFPAHVLFLSFFTNVILLACFLGMSVGCLAARRPIHLLHGTPVLLALTTALAVLGEQFETSTVLGRWVPAQGQALEVFWGALPTAEYRTPWAIPAELLNGLAFLAVAGIMLGPGQEMGRALNRIPDRVRAYSLNIAGSIAGILALAAASWFEIPPLAWFLAIALGITYFLRGTLSGRAFRVRLALLAVSLMVVSFTSFGARKVREPGAPERVREHFWSPYYRIDFEPERLGLWASMGSHQVMTSRRDPAARSYAFPYLLRRDAGMAPFQDVLIIGAGSGNEVSRALQWGALHIDAVEIDPVIARLGGRHHPDRPYADPRVTLHLDDGRNFLRSTTRRYDLVIYGNLDSVVLHSAYSSIRLESYLLTEEAFIAVASHLKPGGWFIVNNGLPAGWVVLRARQQLASALGTQPLVFSPSNPEFSLDGPGGYAILFAGAIEPLRAAFEQHGEYRLRNQAPTPLSPNGFLTQNTGEPSFLLRPSRIQEAAVLKPATDDWPFFYLRTPAVPQQNLWGIALMLGASFLGLGAFLPRSLRTPRASTAAMFLFGAGFLLIETKVIVQAALLFGSTWMVNTFVILAILLLVLAANWAVRWLEPARSWPWFAGLAAALAANLLVPLDSLLGLGRLEQAAAGAALLLSPMFFAGVLFAMLFARSTQPDHDFGANIAGAMAGGLAEYLSLIWGFRGLLFVAALIYSAAALAARRAAAWR